MINLIRQEYSVAAVCDVLDLPRSTYYNDPKIKSGDAELKKTM